MSTGDYDYEKELPGEWEQVHDLPLIAYQVG
jgi:hypothetical protein